MHANAAPGPPPSQHTYKQLCPPPTQPSTLCVHTRKAKNRAPTPIVTMAHSQPHPPHLYCSTLPTLPVHTRKAKNRAPTPIVTMAQICSIVSLGSMSAYVHTSVESVRCRCVRLRAGAKCGHGTWCSRQTSHLPTRVHTVYSHHRHFHTHLHTQWWLQWSWSSRRRLCTAPTHFG